MAKKLAYQQHLTSADDLVASQEQIRVGLIAFALEKKYIAVPYVEEAKALEKSCN